MGEFIDMNGYAGYIWAAYGVTGFILSAMVIAALLKKRALKSQEQHLKKVEKQ